MFDRRDRHARTPAREVALSCLEAGIDAATLSRLVDEAVEFDDDTLRVVDETYDLSTFDSLLVLGGGKAADGLAIALDAVLGDRIDDGVVVTSAGRRTPSACAATGAETDPVSAATGRETESARAGRIELVSGTHPMPTEPNVDATTDLLERARGADARTLVLALVTGGASALLSVPAPGIVVSNLAATTDALVESGASIDEINAVRKHCSSIKGGRLARAAAPATVVTLAMSDVIGDDPAVIASGPTVPDPSTFDDARAVLDRYGLVDRVPDAVVAHLDAGVAGEVAETPTADDPSFEPGHWHLLGNGRTAISAATDAAEAAGFSSVVLSGRIAGEAADAGRFHAAVAAEIRAYGDPVEPPVVLVSGGEATVSVTGGGTGGPNLELALAGALELASSDTDAVLASVDTD